MKIYTVLFLALVLFACSNSQKKESTKNDAITFAKGTYGFDLAHLNKYTKPIELKNGNARVVISPEYQGRVMTSSSEGEKGLSYGWINHDLIQSGEQPKHINPVGGEERIWLGPEGGQYSIFFEAGSKFEFEDWQTPAFIDTDTYEVVASGDTYAEFKKSVVVKNYSNFEFEFDVRRKISLLNENELKSELKLFFQEGLKWVAYRSENELKNTGENGWEKDSGLLSVWLLGMFNPSPEVTIVIPYKTDVVSDYIVKDDYFGKVPEDRLIVKNGYAFFKGDGKQRGKIGIPPQRALPVIGSFDAQNNLLTVVKCEIPEGVVDYVNSAWEMQEFPYKGDAINSYNDGPLEDGSQLGPFYELETSSPALALAPGESSTYSQTTVHFQGTDEELNAICQQLFNLSLNEIKSVFN